MRRPLGQMSQVIWLMALVWAVAGCGGSDGSSPVVDDFDGDGLADELRIEQRDDGTWLAEVAWGHGATRPVDLQAPGDGAYGPLSSEGSFDIDGDGQDEAFAIVFAGADHVRYGIYVAVGEDLVRVTDENGEPYELILSGAYGLSMMFDCPGDGSLILREYLRDYDTQIRYQVSEMRLEGTVLVDRGITETGTLPSEGPIPLPDCSGVGAWEE